jgi:hypothetical protein
MGGYNISEMMNDDDIAVQGEWYKGELFASFVQKPMRPALAQAAFRVGGIMAIDCIRRYFNPCSLEDFNELRDSYPDAVIEFSAYYHKVGMLPHRNVLIWEVREY